MSRDTTKPDPHVINNLHKITAKPLEECAAVFVAHNCEFRAALNALQKSAPLKHIPIPEEPQKVRFDGTLTNGNVIKPGMTLDEITNAVTYPRPTGNAVADRARRLAAKCAALPHTAEQWKRFRAVAGATTFEYEGVEA